jgi:excisionase family DNA binding protein
MARMLKAKEAADFLNVHLETIRRLARQKEIPAFKVGKGWRFSEETLKKWAAENSARPATPHILVIDDEPDVCRFAARLLQSRGYRVSTAPGGMEGLSIIRQEEIHLVLLDLNMPEMDGVSALKKIRAFDEKLPVIIITGYPDSDLMTEAMKVSPILMIPKPLDHKLLFDSIAMALGENKSVTEAST